MVACLWAIATIREPNRAHEPLPRKHTLFLDFEGGQLAWVPTPEDENAAEDTSFMARFEGSTLPAYLGGTQQRQAVLQAVREHMAPFGVRVLDERPSKTVPYTRVMVGGQWTDINADGPLTGVAPNVDCDRVNPRHVVFAFVSDESTARQAMTISQEAAHAWGLDHTLGADRIMGYVFDDAPKVWGQTCTPLCEEECQGPGTVFCHEAHELFCEPGFQNDMAELQLAFGGPDPDLEPPSVVIVSPTDGTRVAPGGSVTVEADIADDFGGLGWRLVVEHDGRRVVDDVAYDFALTWTLSDLPKGTYRITVEAEDHADHVGSDTVVVEVGESVGDGSTGGTTSPPGSTSRGGSDSTGTAGEDGGEDAEADPGCACRARGSGHAPVPGMLLVAVLGLGLARSSFNPFPTGSGRPSCSPPSARRS